MQTSYFFDVISYQEPTGSAKIFSDKINQRPAKTLGYKYEERFLKYYRKRPCISRTFFHKIEGKNQGCGLSMDTSVFGVLKNLINIHTTS